MSKSKMVNISFVKTVKGVVAFHVDRTIGVTDDSVDAYNRVLVVFIHGIAHVNAKK
jgi:hypothetical protein